MSNKSKKVYIIGISGIGMSALAGLFKEAGWNVEGSDRAYFPPASDVLKKIGAKLHTNYDPSNVPEADIYVVGNSVNAENPELQKALKMGPVLSLPEALNRFFTNGKKIILVTGTHGKTTTTGCIWHLLRECGFSPGLFVGGILRNTGTSFSTGKDFFVIEGDEYSTSYNDRRAKFLHYNAHILVINSLEFDHADVYRNMEEIESAFKELIRKNKSAKIFASAEWESIRKIIESENIKPIWYGRGKESTVIPLSSGPDFSYITPRGKISFQNPYLFGRHIASNISGVIAIGLYLGIPLHKIKNALEKFKGIARREEVLLFNEKVVVIDDFAHHPTEVRETLLSVKERFGKRVIAIFEPRTNTSRRNIFFKEYIDALSVADCVYLLPPYRAEGIKEDERLPVDRIAEEISKRGKRAHLLSGYTDLEPLFEEAVSGGAFVFMSAGDMNGMPHRFAERV